MSDLNAANTPGYGFSTSGANTNGSIDVEEMNSFLYPYHESKLAEELIATANALVYPRGKGIYATDESPEGIEARLTAAVGEAGKSEPISVDERREQRRKWRECLYESLPTKYISGVILFSETLHDFDLAPILTARGIIPGIRADTDSHPLPMSPLEPSTQGLDDLFPRMQAAHSAGARFSKWRAPILCDAHNYPTHAALEAQADALGRFAAISQMARLVPVVEPDVDFGADASLERSVEVHVKIISLIYAKCAQYGVLLEGSLIKPSFAQPGLKHPSRKTTSVHDIALATATALARSVPIGVAGVVFLSGGLSDHDASLYLHEINQLVDAAKSSSSRYLPALARLPPLTFSFGRGLQGDAMQKWVKGDEKGAKEAFEERAKVCYTASRGELEA